MDEEEVGFKLQQSDFVRNLKAAEKLYNGMNGSGAHLGNIFILEIGIIAELLNNKLSLSETNNHKLRNLIINSEI